MNRLFLLAFCLLLTTSSYAETWRVTPSSAAQLPEKFSQLKSGDRLVLERGTYRFDEALRLEGLENVTIEGRGRVKLVLTNLDADVISIKKCKNIIIKGLRAKHQTPSKEYKCEGAVIMLRRSSRIFITENQLNGCGAAGVFAMSCKEVVVHKNRIFNNSFAGVWVQSSQVAITKNKIYDNAAGVVSYGDCHTSLTENSLKTTVETTLPEEPTSKKCSNLGTSNRFLSVPR